MQSSMNVPEEYESPISKNKSPQIQQHHIGEWICVPHVLRSHTGTVQSISHSQRRWICLTSTLLPLQTNRICAYCAYDSKFVYSQVLQLKYKFHHKSGCVGKSILRILVCLAWHFCCPYSEDRQQLKNSPLHANKHALCLKLCMDIQKWSRKVVTKEEERYLQCCHQHDLWFCFIFVLV